MQNQTARKELRSFGLLVGGIFAVIGFWPMLLRGEDYRTWALVLAVLLIAPALIYPPALKPLQKVWMKLGHVLGWINTRILLGVIFFGVVTPMGMIRRMLRKDSMGRQANTLDSYRMVRQSATGVAYDQAILIVGGFMGEFLVELWGFMKERKKFWLLPIVLCLVFLGGLIVMTSGSAVAPFIYTLF